MLLNADDAQQQQQHSSSGTVHSYTPCISPRHSIIQQTAAPNGTLSLQLIALQELLEKCHPLGMFDSISTLAVASNMRELYRLVLVDTPLAPYFSESLTAGDLATSALL